MPKSPGKPIEVTVIIKSGPVSPVQLKIWHDLWGKLLCEGQKQTADNEAEKRVQ